jgi:hypothetical protein
MQPTNVARPISIFVYGSLMSKDVTEMLLRRKINDVDLIPARLYGYRRCPVRNEAFPAIVPIRKLMITPSFHDDDNSNKNNSNGANSSADHDDRNNDEQLKQQRQFNYYYVEGLLLCGLNDGELHILDSFEGEDYHRTDCHVEITSSNNNTLPSLLLKSQSSPPIATVQTQVYVWNLPLSQLMLDQLWSYETFCQQSLSQYVRHTVEPHLQQQNLPKRNWNVIPESRKKKTLE